MPDQDSDRYEITPRPDPTILTTKLVDRTLDAFREVMAARLEAIDARLSEVDARSEARDEAARRELDVWREGLNERLALLNLATDKASEALDKRLEATNEWRSDYNTQAANMVRRDLLDQVRSDLETRIAAQATLSRDDRDRLRDSLTSAATRIELAAIAEKVDAVQSAMDQAEGRRTVTAAIIAAASSTIISLAVGLIIFALNHH